MSRRLLCETLRNVEDRTFVVLCKVVTVPKVWKQEAHRAGYGPVYIIKKTRDRTIGWTQQHNSYYAMQMVEIRVEFPSRIGSSRVLP